jgi:hypothetical protein
VRADILFEALAVLRQVKDLPAKDFPEALKWHRVMTAANALEWALADEGLRLTVEKPQEVAA